RPATLIRVSLLRRTTPRNSRAVWRAQLLTVLCSLLVLALGREHVEDLVEDLLRTLKARHLGIDLSKGVVRLPDRGSVRAPGVFLGRGDEVGRTAVRRASGRSDGTQRLAQRLFLLLILELHSLVELVELLPQFVQLVEDLQRIPGRRER